MFDNIFFQPTVCSELRQDILAKSLPPSILLNGPALSGKTTLALELARILTCQNRKELGQWKCDCLSCRQQRELSQKQILVLGSSDFHTEIEVCRKFLDQVLATNFSQKSEQGAKQKHLRVLLWIWLCSLYKVLKRYDEALWPEGKSKTDKERKAQKAQEEFIELLTKLRPKDAKDVSDIADMPLLGDKKSLAKDLNRCQELAQALIAAIPTGIPVQQIRQLQQWSYQTSETCKVAILENVELMNAVAVNAMLKLLEEPPEHCYFILTTRRKQALLPTILSRVRPFGLCERSPAEEQQIVQNVFHSASGDTLKELFLTGEQQDFAAVQAECELFLRGLREGQPFFKLKASFPKLDLEAFLQNLSLLLQRECLAICEAQNQQDASHSAGLLRYPSFAWYQEFLQLSRTAIERHKVYHDSAILILQNIYLQLLLLSSSET